MKIGLLLKSYRTQFNISLRKLSKELKLAASTIIRIEKGCKMDYDTYIIIHRWLFDWVKDV